MRKLPALLTSLLLATTLALTGCTTSQVPGDSAPAARPADQTPASGDVGQGDAAHAGAGSQGGSGAGAPDAPDAGARPNSPATQPTTPATSPKELVQVAPAGSAVHITLDASTPVDQTGLFFLNIETGKVDGWTINTGSDRASAYEVSPDDRWIVAKDDPWQPRFTYLIDRKTGQVYQWDFRQGRLLAAGGAHLLFEVGDRFWLTGEDPAQGQPLQVTPAGSLAKANYQAMAPTGGYQSPNPLYAQALFGPDARTLFLLNGRDLYLVRAESGETTRLAELPAQLDGLTLLNLGFEPVRPDGGLTLTAHYAHENSYAPEQTYLLRYGWDGRKLAEVTLPHDGGLSPDGRFVWWRESLGGFASAVVLADVPDLKPLLRLDGATYETGWLSDSSGLVVRTQKGFGVLTTNGGLLDAAAFAGTHGLNKPVPAPDRADLFLIGGTVVRTRDGRQVVRLSETQWFGIQTSSWGYTSAELAVGLHNWGGKGFSDTVYLLPPQVERPPFDPVPALMVNLPAGDCLNLRTGYTTLDPVITCLPPGTRLSLATSPGRINKGWLEGMPNPLPPNMADASWLYVRTEANQHGWVTFNLEYLTWAPPQPDATPPDPMLTRIGDEKANMAWWLTVALGEAECRLLCSDNSFETTVMAFYNRDREGGGLAATLRQMPDFDPARHEAALKPLEQAAQLIVKTWTDLGQPGLEPSAEWKQAVTEARDLLTGP